MKPTRVTYCDDWGGSRGKMAWRVVYQFDAEHDKWIPLSIPFATEAEAVEAEKVLRK